jgi:hypothetical protein
MAYATYEDVELRLGREFTVDEQAAVTMRLDNVERVIRRRIPDLDDRVLESDDDYLEIVVMVEADVVERYLNNPRGMVGETDGNYSYQLNWSTVTGRPTLYPDEWRLLGVMAGMAVLTPRLEKPEDWSRYCRPSDGIDQGEEDTAVWG